MSIATEIQRLQSAKTDIKTAIENKGVTVGDGTIDTYAEKISEISVGGSGDYEQGFEDGKNLVPQIDRYIKGNPQFTTLNMFKTSEAVLNLDNATSLAQLFVSASEETKNTTVEHLTINVPNAVTGANQMITSSTNDYTLKHLTLNVDLSNAQRFNSMLTKIQALEIIDGTPINLSSATNINSMFSYCTALKEVRFVTNSISLSISFAQSDKLSTETIQSIIDGLADLTGGTAQTLTLHADVGGKLTETQKETITSKNWELVY